MKTISEHLSLYNTDLTSDGYNSLISNIVCIIVLSDATAVLNAEPAMQILLALFAVLTVIGMIGEINAKQNSKQYFAIVYWMADIDLCYLLLVFLVKIIFGALN